MAKIEKHEYPMVPSKGYWNLREAIFEFSDKFWLDKYYGADSEYKKIFHENQSEHLSSALNYFKAQSQFSKADPRKHEILVPILREMQADNEVRAEKENIARAWRQHCLREVVKSFVAQMKGSRARVFGHLDSAFGREIEIKPPQWAYLSFENIEVDQMIIRLSEENSPAIYAISVFPSNGERHSKAEGVQAVGLIDEPTFEGGQVESASEAKPHATKAMTVFDKIYAALKAMIEDNTFNDHTNDADREMKIRLDHNLSDNRKTTDALKHGNTSTTFRKAKFKLKKNGYLKK